MRGDVVDRRRGVVCDEWVVGWVEIGRSKDLVEKVLVVEW